MKLKDIITETTELLSEGYVDTTGYTMERERDYYKAYDPEGNFIGNVDNQSDFEDTVRQDIEEKKKKEEKKNA